MDIFKQEFGVWENERIECPHCENVFMRPVKVDVYYDQSSDRVGACLSVRESTGSKELGEVKISREVNAYRPAPYSNAICITLECEFCAEHSVMTVAKHKGDALLAWRKITKGEQS